MQPENAPEVRLPSVAKRLQSVSIAQEAAQVIWRERQWMLYPGCRAAPRPPVRSGVGLARSGVASRTGPQPGIYNYSLLHHVAIG